MLNIPARYAKDPRIVHVGGHHAVLAGGARVYEITTGSRDVVGRFEAQQPGEIAGRLHDTVFAALVELLGDPQPSRLAQALAAEFEPEELAMLSGFLRAQMPSASQGEVYRRRRDILMRLDAALDEVMPEED